MYYVKDELGEFKTTGTSSQKVADYLADFLNKQDEQIEQYCAEATSYSEELDDLRIKLRELEEEKDYWKGCSCNHINYNSILSMDCQIVQEAIFDLKKVIERDTEAFRLLEELDDKFDDLNKHRLSYIGSDD